MGGDEDDLLSDADSTPPDSPSRDGRDGRDGSVRPGASPSSAPGGAPPPAGKESRRRRLEGVIQDVVRRAVELGVEKAQEAPDNLKQLVGDMKVPKDIAHYLFTQIDDTKNGLFRVVAKEMRDFLEHTNFGGELQKILTTVQFEVNTTIRFTPNDGRDKGKRDDESEELPSSDDLGEGAADDAGAPDSTGSGERRPTPLPRPEVKTSVNVRRDDRSKKRRRD